MGKRLTAEYRIDGEHVPSGYTLPEELRCKPAIGEHVMVCDNMSGEIYRIAQIIHFNRHERHQLRIMLETIPDASK